MRKLDTLASCFYIYIKYRVYEKRWSRCYYFFLFLIVYVIGLVIAEQMIIDKFKINKNKRFANKVHLWGEVALAIVVIAIFYFYSNIRNYFVPIFFTILSGFRAFMEWKYDKDSKSYILSLFFSYCNFNSFLHIKVFYV